MIDPSIAKHLGVLRKRRVRRLMRKHANQRGLLIVTYFKGNIYSNRPYIYPMVVVQAAEVFVSFNRATRAVRWVPLADGIQSINVFLGHDPRLDVFRAGLDLDKGLVLFVDPPLRSGAPGKAILVQNTAVA